MNGDYEFDKLEETEGILDSKTKDILFGRTRERFGFMDDSFLNPARASLDELMQTPLDDLEVINERLDAIGELVANQGLRERVSGIVQAFGIDYDRTLYGQLGEFQREGRWDGYFQERATKGLRATIENIAKSGGKVPLNFGEQQYQTQTLRDLAAMYEEFMQSETGVSVLEFFRYMSELDERIKKVEADVESQQLEPDEPEIETDPLSFLDIISALGGDKEALQRMQSIPGSRPVRREEGISYNQLTESLDVERLARYQSVLQQTRPLLQTIFPYSELAKIAVENNYVRPEVVPREKNCLVIVNGRYDKLERNVVPNNTRLTKRARVEVLEGVNNGGKTIDMKKALYIATLALAGTWVPAEYARVSVRDKIILREKGVGSAISAFQQDCRSAVEASPPSDKYWIIGMDETFTSTERRGGEALTYGLVQHVLDQSNSLLIVSSHYPNLSKPFSRTRRVVFNHFPFERQPSEREEGKTVVRFPYKKRRGPLNDYQYAIAVAGTRDFDPTILEFAQQRLAQRYGSK